MNQLSSSNCATGHTLIFIYNFFFLFAATFDHFFFPSLLLLFANISAQIQLYISYSLLHLQFISKRLKRTELDIGYQVQLNPFPHSLSLSPSLPLFLISYFYFSISKFTQSFTAFHDSSVKGTHLKQYFIICINNTCIYFE